MKDVLMCQDDLLRLRVALIDDPLDLAVDIGSNTLTVRSRMRQISSDEDFVIVAAVVDHSELLRHSVLGYHRGDRLILYNEESCRVYNLDGHEKFNGQFDYSVSLVRAGKNRTNSLITAGSEVMKEINLR